MSEHTLKRQLEVAIDTALSSSDRANIGEIAEEVMIALGKQGVIQYGSPDTLPLLSAAGRVFVCIASNPTITLREMAVMLGVTESNVARSVSKLVKSGVIARTKVKGRNIYSLDRNQAKNHPDIQKFFGAIGPVFEKNSADQLTLSDIPV